MKISSRLHTALATLVHDESGQDLVEYALIVGLLALGTIAGAKSLSSTIATEFSTVGSRLNNNI